MIKKNPSVRRTGRPSRLSIIIPVYNEQQTIGEVIRRVRAVRLENLEKEIIIIDDSSTDMSRDEILKAQKLDPKTTKVHLSFINLGKGASIRMGLKYATGDIIIIQDADLELNPEEYITIIDPILQGKADVVYGSRFLRHNKNIPLTTRFANSLLTILTNVLYGTHLTDMETAYKAFRREILGGIRLRALEFEFEPEITARIIQKGYRIHEVPIAYHPRTKEEGKKISFIDGMEAIFTLLRCKLRA
jgi:glycosyltransferase involved in cell wall biosynthesis